MIWAKLTLRTKYGDLTQYVHGSTAACLSYLSEDKCQQPRGRQSQSLSRPPKRWAVRTSSSRSRLKKHTQPLNDLGFIVQPISLLETKTRGGPPQYRIKDGNGTTIPYGNEILPNGRIFRIFIHFPFLKKEYSIRISAVCLHCQLFIYLFSCLFTFSAVCLLFQLFIYIVSCYVHVQLFLYTFYLPPKFKYLTEFLIKTEEN